MKENAGAPQGRALQSPKDTALSRQELEEIARRLPESDGEPWESPWHGASLALLLDILSYMWRSRYDYFIGGNMFFYYRPDQRPTEDFKGPDFFLVEGADRRKRRDKWVVWMEDYKYPELIIEFLSSTTAQFDLTIKKALYEKVFRSSEYFCFDPADKLPRGWRLQDGKYEPILPNQRGWLWSEKLDLWIGTWHGSYFNLCDCTWLRFYDSDGYLVHTGAEAERLRAEAAHLEYRQLLLERKQREKERRQQESALAENAHLKAALAEKGPSPQ